MEAFGLFADGYANVHIELWEHLRAKTFAALEANVARKAGMRSPEEICTRGAEIRETFLESIGGLPEPGLSLNERVCGTIQRNGYRIHTIVYESQPRVYVTSALYVPDDLDAPVPGILFVCGHHRDAKGAPEYQRVCHDLAINGMVALAIDPTGQGERVTHLDPKTGAMVVEWGTTEHCYQGQQCILTGTSIARIFLLDALRGIDLLQSRAEVDSERIGITGNSGGGTQTSLVCMCGDPRIKAAVPCTYVTSREHYYMTGQPQDAEQLQFAMTRNGIDFDDFFLPFAPRPLLIGGVSSDFFNPEGTDLTYRRLRRIYGLLGRQENVKCVFGPGQHAYSRELREAAVNWFRVHLQGRAGDFISEPDDGIETLPVSDLWCTREGHVLTDMPEARTPYHCNLDAIPLRGPSADAAELRKRVTASLGIEARLGEMIPLFPRTIRDQDIEGVRARSILFCSEPGITLAGCLLSVGERVAPVCTLYLSETGTRDMDAVTGRFRDSLGERTSVFVLDVRGKGALIPHPVNGYPDTFPMTFFNTEAWLAWSAYCLGESLLGMRVFDVLRAAQCMRESLGAEDLAVEAAGLAPSLWGYLAAALDPRIGRTSVDALIPSFESVVKTQRYRKDITPSMLLHGVLRECDLPELRSLFDGRTLTIVEAFVNDMENPA